MKGTRAPGNDQYHLLLFKCQFTIRKYTLLSFVLQIASDYLTANHTVRLDGWLELRFKFVSSCIEIAWTHCCLVAQCGSTSMGNHWFSLWLIVSLVKTTTQSNVTSFVTGSLGKIVVKIKIQKLLFEKRILSASWKLFCPVLNMLTPPRIKQNREYMLLI